MTQEEKQLLFRDLCTRLPYGVVIHTDWKDIKLDHDHCGIGMLYYEHYNEEAKKECGYDENDCSIIISGCCYGDIKPYLRPMSSMTEEELEEFRTLIFPEASCAYEDCLEWDVQIIDGGYLQIYVEDFSNVIDWLNTHHFNYRLPPHLFIEAPKGMYKTE